MGRDAVAPAPGSTDRLAELLQYPVVVDARNIWDVAALSEHGLTVASVGRPQTQVPGA